VYEGHGTQSLQAAASGSSARFCGRCKRINQVHALRVSNFGRYSKPTIGSAKTFIVVSLGNVSREPISCVFYISLEPRSDTSTNQASSCLSVCTALRGWLWGGGLVIQTDSGVCVVVRAGSDSSGDAAASSRSVLL
jgi:hypothetical protein